MNFNIEDVMTLLTMKSLSESVQFGSQTPLNLAKRLLEAGAPIIGTSVKSIQRAEDRDELLR